MKRKSWKWGINPLAERERDILIGILSSKIDESESGNNWAPTPYSEDLRLIREKLEDLQKYEFS